MTPRLILLLATLLLTACPKQAISPFTINENSLAQHYTHNPSFKEVYNKGLYFYFKGSPTTYYGINMADNAIFSGYIIFNGKNPVCYSQLNFKGRKAFNHLLNQLQDSTLLAKNSKPIEGLGWIVYKSSILDNPASNQIGIVSLKYNTDYDFGGLSIQSSGCLKAIFTNAQ